MSETRQRLDRWLFFSRAVKSRSLAQKLIEAGAVRVNAERTVASDRRIGPGDVLTMTMHQQLRVWRVLDSGSRRGPAAEAALLYEDISPPPLPREPLPPIVGERLPGAGRPTKKERRQTTSFTGAGSIDGEGED
ncbi:MAG TPA: RNA-binding S4 domain-containing protein [Devosiaceae bacterium]|jgi:ribosome-associated heat shock protein Hsp15|nr:RNA-binding S4 domain-containing protein [Devosiaceae bacterium]